MKRSLVCVLLSILLLTLCAVALADVWNCPNCGQLGNTGRFCPNCGQAAPVTSWTCPNCLKTDNSGNFCTFCGTARPSNTNVNVNTVDPGLEQIPGEINRVKVRIANVSSSSYIVNSKNPSSWLPQKAADGDESTCWQFSTKTSSLGNAWLQLDLQTVQTIHEIWLKNGFWAYSSNGTDQYQINCRPKEIQVEFRKDGYGFYQDPIKLNLTDSRSDWQRFDLGTHEKIASVRIWVLSAYTGTKYKNDVCLSEVMLVRLASSSSAQQAGPTNPPTVYSSSTTSVEAKLLMRLSTRSGPATEYDEPGTFFNNNWQSQKVKVMGKSWDGNIWWVLVDFKSGNNSYRVWTGLKRVDVNLDLVPEIYATGQGTVNATETRRGPGNGYAKGPAITSWQDVEAFGRENGYVEVEYHDWDKNRVYRVWVPENKTSIDWNWNQNP